MHRHTDDMGDYENRYHNCIMVIYGFDVKNIVWKQKMYLHELLCL